MAAYAQMPIPDDESTSVPKFTPSPQQLAIFRWIESESGHAFVEATAGSGKTTTLLHGCARMSGSVAFAAFNKKIADEIKFKLEQRRDIGAEVRAGTFHSFGFSAWRRVAPKVMVDDREKRDRMIDELRIPDHLVSCVTKMVSIAKQAAVGLAWQPDDSGTWNRIIDHFDLGLDFDPNREEYEREQVVELATHGIAWAREVGHGLIDFDDMIWLPITTPGVRIWQNDWVLVDEAQDTNPARRELAARMVKPTGRMLWVGDRHQAIYGFTGADADAVDLIIRKFRCVELPLTVTYRCPKSVVKVAQGYVPHIEAHETAPDGEVRNVDREAFDKLAPELTSGDAILCRNTRPLVSLAFSLIRRGVGCYVEGRDIGAGLAKLATRWKVKSTKALGRNLEAYRIRETDKLMRSAGKGAEYAIEALNDKIDTLLIVMEGCDTIECVTSKIDRMFRDTGAGRPATVVLSTIHKAKGREWRRVYILGWNHYLPSKYARQPWQQEQERNLAYVAVTRSMSELGLTVAMEG